MNYIERIMAAHPDWPRRIRHGEYIGVLSGVQPLLKGDAAPLYRFPGGECVGDPGDAVRTAPIDEHGLLRCGCCGGEILCDENGDMPDLCPACHEGIDWSASRKVTVKFLVLDCSIYDGTSAGYERSLSKAVEVTETDFPDADAALAHWRGKYPAGRYDFDDVRVLGGDE